MIERNTAPTLRWEVTEDMIDLDHWANVHVELVVADRKAAMSPFVRIGFLPIAVLCLVVIAFTVDRALALQAAVLITVVFIGARLWNRGAVRRLARNLRAIPAASEPFVFTADSGGTHSDSASGSETLTWSRYRSARRVDDLIVLGLDTGTTRILPVKALVGARPEHAVDLLTGWITSTR